MRLKSVYIAQYKNLKDSILTFASSSFIDVFVGKKATGKSSLFEALREIFRPISWRLGSLVGFLPMKPNHFQYNHTELQSSVQQPRIWGGYKPLHGTAGAMIMNENRKKRLIDLGAEALADALLELANFHHAADDLVERMIATPTENIYRFKLKLAGIKRSQGFVSWGESAGFARELEILLQDLKAGVNDPQKGAELVVSFYETDKGALGNCDDSDGNVGDVYRYDAKELLESCQHPPVWISHGYILIAGMRKRRCHGLSGFPQMKRTWPKSETN
jgi:hypothetical protein